MSKPVLFWLSILCLFTGATFGWMAYKRTQANRFGSVAVVDPDYLRAPQSEPLLKSFSLTERSGRTFNSDELRGKVSVASFFYSLCPTECLQQNAKLGELVREYEGKDVVFLAISCDPEVDDPARLREYARKLGADEKRWLFLTGNVLYTRRIGAEIYQVPVDVRSHTERFIIIGRGGVGRPDSLAGHFNWKEPAQMTAVRRKIDEELKKPIPADEPTAETPATEQPAQTPPVESAE